MRRADTFFGTTRLELVFVSLLNCMRFVVWVVSWLCLAHLDYDWDGLSTRERRWEGEGGLEKMEKKGGDWPQMIGSMSFTFDGPFVGRRGGSVWCMCGPFVRAIAITVRRKRGRVGGEPTFHSPSTVWCMCGPLYVRFPLQQEEREEG